METKAVALISGSVVLCLVAIELIILGPPVGDLIYLILRFCAIVGIICLFMASLMTPFQRELRKIFGRSFIQIHHAYTITGLILVTLHPLLFALDLSLINQRLEFLVFFPDFGVRFWELAGRPALILFYITFFTALYRNVSILPKYWKYIHYINYLGLTFGVIHANLIGTNVKASLPLFLLINGLLIISYGVLIYKRYQNYQRKKRIQARGMK
ncbi:MAG: ferric reductase [Promethearchaeota archaeon]